MYCDVLNGTTMKPIFRSCVWKGNIQYSFETLDSKFSLIKMKWKIEEYLVFVKL